MIEILYSMLIILGFHTLLFFVLHFTVTIESLKISINTIIFIENSLFLLILIFYASGLIPFSSLFKKYYEYNSIHEIQFYPIKNLNSTTYWNGTFLGLSYNLLYDKSYRIYKTKEFSKECLENYYINSSHECPITQIKIGNGKIDNLEFKNYTKIKISDDRYLYFTNQDKKGQLYEWNYQDRYNFNFSSNYSYKEFFKVKRKEDDKLFIIDLQKLNKKLKFLDYIGLILIGFSFFYGFIGIVEFCYKELELELNYIYILDLIIQCILFILSLIQFIKFIDIKNFFLKSKNIYKIDYDDYNGYFPNKTLNFESIPPAFFLIKPLIFLFQVIFIEKYKCCIHKKIKTKYYILMGFLPLIILFIICYIFGTINGFKIQNFYSDLKYNWRQRQ